MRLGLFWLVSTSGKIRKKPHPTGLGVYTSGKIRKKPYPTGLGVYISGRIIPPLVWLFSLVAE